jgi:hypothetical protein
MCGEDAGRVLIHKVQEGHESRGNLTIASRDLSHGRIIEKYD